MNFEKDIKQIQELFEEKEKKYIQQIGNLQIQLKEEKQKSLEQKIINKELKTKVKKYQQEIVSFKNQLNEQMKNIQQNFENQKIDLLEKLAFANYKQQQETEEKIKYKELLEKFTIQFQKFVNNILVQKQQKLEIMSRTNYPKDTIDSIVYTQSDQQNQSKSTQKRYSDISQTFSIYIQNNKIN